jgi:hypothetical protein
MGAKLVFHREKAVLASLRGANYCCYRDTKHRISDIVCMESKEWGLCLCPFVVSIRKYAGRKLLFGSGGAAGEDLGGFGGVRRDFREILGDSGPSLGELSIPGENARC